VIFDVSCFLNLPQAKCQLLNGAVQRGSFLMEKGGSGVWHDDATVPSMRLRRSSMFCAAFLLCCCVIVVPVAFLSVCVLFFCFAL